MERDLALVWKEVLAMRGQMQSNDIGAGGRPPSVAAWPGAPSVGEAYEHKAEQPEPKLLGNAQDALANLHQRREEKDLQNDSLVCEEAFANQAKRHESHLADLQARLKRYCDDLFKEVSQELHEELDALQDHLNDSLKHRNPSMFTVHEQADQELLSHLEEALDREIAARQDADKELLTTVHDLLLEQEERALKGQAHCEKAMRHSIDAHAVLVPGPGGGQPAV